MMSETVSFKDADPGHAYWTESSYDMTRKIADRDDATLDNFFRRPIKIASYTWGTGTTFFQDFNPWTLYWQNLRVINRLTNYNLLRAKMHVKILINGNSFFYGRAIATYLPLANSDDFDTNRALIPQDLIRRSQLPHIYLDPTTSMGGDLCLPFFWNRNTLSIPNQQWTDMGEMNIRSMTTLKHANGAAAGVTVNVFAWAEDVEFSIPTSFEPGSLAPQSGDEYGSGPISMPASIISKAAGALLSAPYIGPYMRATELAASKVAAVARLFGYSRPVSAAEITLMTPRALGNIANYNLPDSSTKLSLDIKQELSIDPRLMGIGPADEMEIKSIAMRESYLTSFTWGTATASETMLWNCRVNPVLHDIVAATEYHLTPAAHVSLPFMWWRGSMEFRFQVVCSGFHKGRLAIAFDPNYFQSAEYNIQYTRIVDIADETDITVKVGWGNQYSWLRTRDPSVNSFPFTSGTLGPSSNNFDNGVIGVRVLNALTTPNSTVNNDVTILVSVKMCDDFEVAEPSDQYANFVYFKEIFDPQGRIAQLGEELLPIEEMKLLSLEPQSGEEEGGTTMLTGPPPLSTADMVMSSPLNPSDQTNAVYMGEVITSIRALMKRSYFYGVHAPTATNAGPLYGIMQKCNFPLYRGYAPSAVHVDGLGTPYNFFLVNPITYFTPCFGAVRGGLRWKYQRSGSQSATQRMGVVRGLDSYTYGITTAATPSWSSLSVQNRYYVDNPFGGTNDGAAETNTGLNPVLEVELPYYSQNRFTRAREANPASAWEGHGVYGQWGGITLAVNAGQTNSEYVSVGEDFGLYYYLNVPIMYLNTFN